MLKPFVCGTGSFEQEEDEPWRSKSCRNTTINNTTTTKTKPKIKKIKNPYSSRGLEKFATVLAELDEKRRKIYDQLGSPDASLVRFGYSSSKDWVPIVVKLKEQRENKGKIGKENHKPNSEALIIKPQTVLPVSPVVQVQNKTKKINKKKGFMWRKPQLCLLTVIVFILMCLLISGKSFAILCTSILWYAMPTIKKKNNQANSKQSTKKKEYGRWLSEKKMVSDATKPQMMVKSFKRGQSNKNW